MKIIINAGHTLEGAGTGAVGLLNESKETRKIVDALVNKLRNAGHIVHTCNIDLSPNYLKDVCTNANYIGGDLFISIHLNAFNGNARGCEVFTWKGQKTKTSINICENLSKLGFKNRGVKDGSHLYVVKNTKMKAILVEVCFLDNKEDVELYKKLGVNKIAEAIAKSICTCNCNCSKCK